VPFYRAFTGTVKGAIVQSVETTLIRTYFQTIEISDVSTNSYTISYTDSITNYITLNCAVSTSVNTPFFISIGKTVSTTIKLTDYIPY